MVKVKLMGHGVKAALGRFTSSNTLIATVTKNFMRNQATLSMMRDSVVYNKIISGECPVSAPSQPSTQKNEESTHNIRSKLAIAVPTVLTADVTVSPVDTSLPAVPVESLSTGNTSELCPTRYHEYAAQTLHNPTSWKEVSQLIDYWSYLSAQYYDPDDKAQSDYLVDLVAYIETVMTEHSYQPLDYQLLSHCTGDYHSCDDTMYKRLMSSYMGSTHPTVTPTDAQESKLQRVLVDIGLIAPDTAPVTELEYVIGQLTNEVRRLSKLMHEHTAEICTQHEQHQILSQQETEDDAVLMKYRQKLKAQQPKKRKR